MTTDKEIDNVPDTNVQPKDTYGFSKLTATELRKVITDLVKTNEEVADAKKMYDGAANDTIKEGKTRITAALEFLKIAERTLDDALHETNVTNFLARKNATQA